MVLVAVGEEDAPHLVGLFQHIFRVGNDDVDAVHVAGGEHEAHIDDDHVIAVLQHQHVLADFTQPAQGDNAQQGVVLILRIFSLITHAIHSLL